MHYTIKKADSASHAWNIPNIGQLLPTRLLTYNQEPRTNHLKKGGRGRKPPCNST